MQGFSPSVAGFETSAPSDFLVSSSKNGQVDHFNETLKSNLCNILLMSWQGPFIVEKWMDLLDYSIQRKSP